MIDSDESEPCTFQEVLAALMALIGEEVELTVTPASRSARSLVFAQGILRAGPVLGSGEDTLVAVWIGNADLALKRSWLERAWRSPSGSWLELLFVDGVMVEIDRVEESGRG